MNDDLKWVELKAKLRFVEEKVLRITEIDGWVSTKELYEQVKDLLSDRHNILNQMFRNLRNICLYQNCCVSLHFKNNKDKTLWRKILNLN